MGAGRHQPEHIFQRHLGQRERGQCPVDRGDDHRAAGRQHAGNGGGEQPPVGDMLDHLGGIDDIKDGAVFGKRLGGHAAIVDLEAAFRRMPARCLDGLRGGVDAGHGAAKPRHRFRQQAAATADVEDAKTAEAVFGPAGADPADAVDNVVEAHRREIMKRRHRPVGIPPA